MSNYNRRYIVLQDKNLESAEVTEVKSTTVPDSSEPTKASMYGESSFSPAAKDTSSSLGDMSVSASGSVDPAFADNTSSSNTYAYDAGSTSRKTSGTGIITESGSASAARFSTSIDGDNAYQLRTTPNYFGKVPFTLSRESNLWDSSDPSQPCISRTAMLSLKNGNIASAYLKSKSAPWTWNFKSNLADLSNSATVATITSYTDNAPIPGKLVLSSLTFGTGSISSASPNFTFITDSSTMTESSVIFDVTAVDVSAGEITIAYHSFSAPSTLYIKSLNKWDNKPEADLKIRMSRHEDGFWSSENSNYPYFFPVSVTPNLTGVSLVQFDDTEEVLCLTSGFVGSAGDFLSTSSFLNVDRIRSSFDSYSGFSSGVSASGDYVDRRSSSVLFEQEGWLANSVKTDVAGLVSGGRPLDITAQVLPSGRLVCVVAFPDNLIALVSDDRGMSFSATTIMSLQFNSTDTQQFVSLDSEISPQGDMVLLLVANPIGDRSYSNTVPAGADILPSSIVSLFISSSGTEWSSEKNIGSNFADVAYSRASGGSSAASYPQNFPVWLDESVYGLDGSVCFTPEGHLLVSLCTLNLGGPGNQQGGHIYQRVCTPPETVAGLTSQQLAPSLPPVIFSSLQPVAASISRLGMALPYVAKGRDELNDSYPVLNDYFKLLDSTLSHLGNDTGYLGSAYFAGVRQVGSATLEELLFGGGPIFGRGPIAISTIRHRGEVVTAVADLWESQPSDSPNSHLYIRGAASSRQSEVSLHVLRSGGLQPLRANVPNELKRFEMPLSCSGDSVVDRYDDEGSAGLAAVYGVIINTNFNAQSQDNVDTAAVTFNTYEDLSSVVTTPARTVEIGSQSFALVGIASSGLPAVYTVSLSGGDISTVYDGDNFSILGIAGVSTSTIKDAGAVFGSNCFQASILGAKDPEYWGWLKSNLSGYGGLYVSDDDAGINYANKWEINTPTGSPIPYCYYDFGEGLTAGKAYSDNVFPNTEGLALDKTMGGQTYGTSQREANSFISRAVVQIQKGGVRGSLTTVATSHYLRCGVTVCLKDDSRGASYNKFLGMGLSIARPLADPENVYFSLIRLSGTAGLPNSVEMLPNSEITMSDNGDGTDMNEKLPYYEIVWGARFHSRSSNSTFYTPFIFVRPWNRYADPAMQGPFTTPSVVVSDIEDNEYGYENGSEIFRFGSFVDASEPFLANVPVLASFAAVQMSRSFLQEDSCFAEMFSPDSSGVYRNPAPEGMGEFVETLEIEREPALDFLRSCNAGQMSPMAFSNCTPSPQVVDNGIALSFKGRATTQKTFSYEGESRFPVLSIMDAPIKDGWRSPSETLTFDVVSENTPATIESAKLPTYEITLRVPDGVNPEAVSFFGLNSASVRVDFNTSATFGDYGSSTQPDFTMLFCTPGDPSSLLFNYFNNNTEMRVGYGPYSDPSVGEQFLVLSPATGAWSGQEGKIATYLFSGSYSFSNPYRGQAVRRPTPTSSSAWFLHMGSLSWIEYAKIPRIFYKPVYLQHFQKYSLLDPTVDPTVQSWRISADSPNVVYFPMEPATTVQDVVSSTPGSPSGFVGQSYLMSSGASIDPNYIITSDGSVWSSQAPSLGQTVKVSSTASSVYAGRVLSYRGYGWAVDKNEPPFRVSQYKSQSNESFYLVVVDRRAALFSDGTVDVLDDLQIQNFADMGYTYYYKIVDNGSNYLELDRSIADMFRSTEAEAASDTKLTPGSMTIVSDRLAANTPDFYSQMAESSGLNDRYEYVRITVCGGNHSDSYLKLGAALLGQRINLSYPDFSLGYSYNLESGSSLFDSLSGRRKSRRNHKPRKSWEVSYQPRPSAPTQIVGRTSTTFGTEVQNSVGGIGNFRDPVTEAAQNQTKAKASWQELLDRVLAMGINGPMLALGFDGNNMQTVSGTVINVTPAEGNLKPALSDPNGLCPVRLTGYAGATNVAYSGQSSIANSQYGAGSQAGLPSPVSNQTECNPTAIMEIKGLKFSEEL